MAEKKKHELNRPQLSELSPIDLFSFKDVTDSRPAVAALPVTGHLL